MCYASPLSKTGGGKISIHVWYNFLELYLGSCHILKQEKTIDVMRAPHDSTCCKDSYANHSQTVILYCRNPLAKISGYPFKNQCGITIRQKLFELLIIYHLKKKMQNENNLSQSTFRKVLFNSDNNDHLNFSGS